MLYEYQVDVDMGHLEEIEIIFLLLIKKYFQNVARISRICIYFH